MSLSSDVVLTLARKGELPFVRVGREYIFRVEDIIAWLNRSRQSTTHLDELLDGSVTVTQPQSAPVKPTLTSLPIRKRSIQTLPLERHRQ